jgi:hypothetical protein
MSDEPFDAKKLAAECKAAVGKRRPKRGEIPLPEEGPRPGSKYRPEYAPQAKKLCAAGFTVPELAAFFEVNKSTINDWRAAYPEFEEAVRLGRDPATQRTKLSLYALANGYDFSEEVAHKVKVDKDREEVVIVEVRKHKPPDYQAAAFFLVNKASDEFKHLSTKQHSGEVVHKVSPADARKELAEWMKGEAAPAPAKAAPAKPH